MTFVKIKQAFLLVLACTALLMACKKAAVKPDTVEPKPVEPKPEKFTYTANVYACGYINDTIKRTKQAIYWKNGVANLLTTGSVPAVANAITVKDNDVYVAGYVANDAVYWKNGLMINVEAGTKASLATDIFISGNDIYLAGYVGDDAVYWKNGVRTTLSRLPENYSACAFGVSVTGSDVYVCGYQFNSQTLATPTLWKNGTPITLPGIDLTANNIVIQNNDVYVAANYGSFSTNNTWTNYWKNGTSVILPKPIPINTFEIAVEGANIYLAGNTDNGPAYYKNDHLTIIDEKTGRIRALAVLNNDVYVAGYSADEKDAVATFWKNGQVVKLLSTVGKVSSISDIVITPL